MGGIAAQAHAFVPSCQPFMRAAAFAGEKRRTALCYADSPFNEFSGMKPSEMKKELESYGISTKSMFDKKEFEEALKEARVKNGLGKDAATMNSKEKNNKNDILGNKTKRELSSKWKSVASATKKALDNLKENPFHANTSKTSSSPSDKSNSREERYNLALEEGAKMKLSILKKELENRGISTKSFFEKSDLVEAYANSIADNKTSTSRHRGSSKERESFDPSYKDVIMHNFDPASILAGDIVIDITEAMG